MHTLSAVGGLVFAAALSMHGHAHAEWFGSIGITSDNIERGVSQSDRRPSASATLGLRHPAGAQASLGIASVSDAQYVGSQGYKLMPALGWDFAGPRPDSDWRAGLSLRGQVFPGARGPWFGSLPARLQTQAALADTDYGTLELGGSLGWKLITLSVSRSLTNYLGLATRSTAPAGPKGFDSKGTTYLGIDLDWPLTDALTLSAGAGRLQVQNFDELSYNDWRLAASLQAAGLRWGLQASGSSADSARYRSRQTRSEVAAGARLTASVAWSF